MAPELKALFKVEIPKVEDTPMHEQTEENEEDDIFGKSSQDENEDAQTKRR